METLGRYILVKKIASGGMADIFQAKLIGVEGFVKDVAIKKILPCWSDNPDFVAMLIDEAKVLLHLNHPNIVQVFEFNKEDDHYYLVMEYIKGVDLKALVRKYGKKPLPINVALHIISQVALGLKYAHQKCDEKGNHLGIVHRDISPQNILISFDGEVKLTDFGIAKARGKSSETVTGTIKGKFCFMSPEQARGEEIDHRSDIFAVGLVLYELVTGKRCFDGSNDFAVLDLVKKAEIQFPENCELPEGLKDIILRCLKKDPIDRYQNISEFLEDIEKFSLTLEETTSTQSLISFIKKNLDQEIKKHQEENEFIDEKTLIHLKTIRSEVDNRKKTKILVANPAPKDDFPIDQMVKARSSRKNNQAGFSRKLIASFFLLCLIVVFSVYQVLNSDQETSQNIEVYSLKPKELSPKIEIPQEFEVNLEITSNPKAKIEFLYQDGKTKQEVGQNNLNFFTTKDELIKVRINQEGFYEVENEYQLTKDNPKLSEKIQLRPKPVLGKIDIKTHPENANIKVKTNQDTYQSVGKFFKEISYFDNYPLKVEITKGGYYKKVFDLELSKDNPDFKGNIKLDPVEYGKLWVGARPWGKVSLAEIGFNQDAPLRDQKLPVGHYELSISYPPENKIVNREITIAKDHTLKCRVNFLVDNHIDCN
jgi:serine/threonine protein kinase